MSNMAIKHVKNMRHIQNKGLKSLQKLNAPRIQSLKYNINKGENIYVDLGCGNGRFGAKLAEITKKWVIGIDISPEHSLFISKGYGLKEYGRAERFLYLPYGYSHVLSLLSSSLKWLSGKAEKTFMIMPSLKTSFHEETALWVKFAGPKGELHIRTENKRITHQMPIILGCRKIPFDRTAHGIHSHFSENFANTMGWHLHTYSFKLK